MAHFALLDDANIVQRVVVVSNEDILIEGIENEKRGQELCSATVTDGRWVQTSFNHNFRRRFAGVGARYDDVLDAFISMQPYPSWYLDIKDIDYDAKNFDVGYEKDWFPPVPKPTDTDTHYEWNEQLREWDLYRYPTTPTLETMGE